MKFDIKQIRTEKAIVSTEKGKEVQLEKYLELSTTGGLKCGDSWRMTGQPDIRCPTEPR